MSEIKVAVITPYYKESLNILRTCHDSVAGQTYPCTHFMMADGAPCDEISQWPVQHIVLAKAHANNGNTPRAIGAISAINQNFEALAFLDADNWYRPDHIASLIELHHSTGAIVCTTGRSIHRTDGSFMYTDTFESNGESFTETSCLLLTKKAFKLASYWALMPREMGPNCDRFIWQAILARNLSRAHNPKPTVAFRTQYAIHYQNISEQAPDGSKKNENTTVAATKWWESQDKEVRDAWDIYLESGVW